MKRALICVLLAGVLAGLVVYSIRLAGNCAYAMDECQNVSMARLLATGQPALMNNSISLFLFPLMWISRGAEHSSSLFVSARFFALELYWLNVVLLALATGARLRSVHGMIALLAAATLAPLWNFGLEIRPDNLVLAGLLFMWCVVRVRPQGTQSFAIAGALVAVLGFVSGKSLVYTACISAAALIYPPPGCDTSRRKLVAAWLAGIVAGVVIAGMTYRFAGSEDVFRASLHNLFAFPDYGNSINGSWTTFSRLLTQTPLLLALATGGVATAVAALRNGKQALSWDGLFPEALLFLLAIADFLVSPHPAAYGLLYVTAFAFLLAFRCATLLWQKLHQQPVALPAAVGLVLFAHLVPFGVAVERYSMFTNYRQEGLMDLAEEMTDPAKDLVYDGLGMVPTRRSMDSQWLLQQPLDENPSGTQTRQVPERLAANPPAVIISNSRTDLLLQEDQAFIRQDYVPLADDFRVLGKILPGGGGEFNIIRAGRYQITLAEASNISGTYPEPKGVFEASAPEPEFPPLAGTIDGVPFNGKPVELSAGTHHFVCAPGTQPAVVWLGPHLDRIRRLRASDHRDLFVKWL